VVVPANQAVRFGHIGVDPAVAQAQQAEQQAQQAVLVNNGWMATIMLVVEAQDFQLVDPFQMAVWVAVEVATPH
jgi:hypothetical protein